MTRLVRSSAGSPAQPGRTGTSSANVDAPPTFAEVTPPMPTSRVIIVLYAFVATVNVMASHAGQSSLDWATKPLLMPLLAGVVVFAAHEAGRRPSPTLLAALATATAGDVALMADGTLPFLIGMAAFLGCQV